MSALDIAIAEAEESVEEIMRPIPPLAAANLKTRKTPRERAEELADDLQMRADLAHDEAGQSEQNARAAFHADDMIAEAAHVATAQLRRGQAIAYADAAASVKLLAIWIPEDA